MVDQNIDSEVDYGQLRPEDGDLEGLDGLTEEHRDKILRVRALAKTTAFRLRPSEIGSRYRLKQILEDALAQLQKEFF